jgi:hypothetical protein
LRSRSCAAAGDPTAGYDARLAERIESLLPILVRRKVRLVGNFGAANPLAAPMRSSRSPSGSSCRSK